jgi:hypothetical protein
MDNWVSLLIQVPLVGVFIWYSLEMNKRMVQSQEKFMDALDRRDAAFENRNNSVITAINHMNESICLQLTNVQKQQEEHDRYVRDNTVTANRRRST